MNKITEKVIRAIKLDGAIAIETPSNKAAGFRKSDALKIGSLVVDRIWEISSPAKPWSYMGVNLAGNDIGGLVDKEKIWPVALEVLNEKRPNEELEKESWAESALDAIISHQE